MISRLAGRLLTGPLAFLVAGVVDIVALTLCLVRARVAATRAAATARSRVPRRARGASRRGC